MTAATFKGYQISNNSYCVFKATNRPRITTLPRTLGGILQESSIVDRTLTLKSYLIPPKTGITRLDVENYFNALNEQIGEGTGTLVVNDNEYDNLAVESIDYDEDITKEYIRFSIDFKFDDQDGDSSSAHQLSVPGLLGFSRGRKIRFDTIGNGKSFHFWHNFDTIRKLETSIRNKGPARDRNARIIKTGGFENIKCMGWVIGPETNTRQNLEAYFYNIINGPMGKLGNIIHDGETVARYAILTEFNMEDFTGIGVKYILNFLASLQC